MAISETDTADLVYQETAHLKNSLEIAEQVTQFGCKYQEIL